MDDIRELLKWVNQKITLKRLALLAIGCVFLNSFLHNNFRPMELKDGNFPLELKWSAKMSDKVYAFSTSENVIIFAQSPYSLNALDASSGKLLWKFLTKGGTSSSSALNGIVYVCDKTSLYALNENNGTKIWQQPLLLWNTGTIIGISEEIILLNDSVGVLSAYKTQNGAFLWDTPTRKGERDVAFIDTDNNIVYNFSYIAIQALDALTGKLIWQISDNQFEDGFYDNGMIFRAYDTGVNAFDIQSKSILWEKQMDTFDSYNAKYVSVDKNIIVTTPVTMLSIQKTNGLVKWLKNYKDDIPNRPTIIKNQLFIMEGFSRIIRVYDVNTGAEIGGLRISLPVFAAVDREEMISVNNMLIFANGKIVYSYGK